jgi:hypothetical protein
MLVAKIPSASQKTPITDINASITDMPSPRRMMTFIRLRKGPPRNSSNSSTGIDMVFHGDNRARIIR